MPEGACSDALVACTPSAVEEPPPASVEMPPGAHEGEDEGETVRVPVREGVALRVGLLVLVIAGAALELAVGGGLGVCERVARDVGGAVGDDEVEPLLVRVVEGLGVPVRLAEAIGVTDCDCEGCIIMTMRLLYVSAMATSPYAPAAMP